MKGKNMATEIVTNVQSLLEVRTHFCNFAPDLPSGVTLVSATATHVPPSGTASVPVVSVVAAPIVHVTLGPLSVIGEHIVKIVATLSDAEKSEMRLRIPVQY
jgi:hypothetical protein